MRRTITALTSLSALALLASPVTAQDDGQTRGEKQLERLLKDRVAGEPERCVYTFPQSRITIVDGEGIVVRSGGKIYFNRTTNPEDLDSDDILVIRRYGGSSNLCDKEMLETYSRTGAFFTGLVSLEEFVPYTLVDRDDG